MMAAFPLRLHTRRQRPLGSDGRRFALGTRSVADLIAPAALEVRRDHLRLDGQLVRTLTVTGYPRTVSPGWLSPLIDFEEPLELSLHLYPLQSAQMVSTLSHKMVQLHSSRLLAARGGRLPDPEREVAYEDAERLRDALQRGEEKIYSVGLYVLLRASTLSALDALTRKVELTLGSLLAHSRVAILEQDSGFHSCLPEGRDRLAVSRNLDTSSLATMFPFSSSTLTMERGVLYGIAKHNHSPVIVDPFDESLENANMVIFATSGAGKSYFTKLMALRNLLADVEFLVIDPEDEYRALCNAVGGQYIRLASTSSQHLNPFDIPPSTDDEEEGPDTVRVPLAEQVVALLALLEIMLTGPDGRLTSQERAVLDRAIYKTYGDAGITDDPASHARPVPLLRDLHSVLEDSSGEVTASLATRLERYVEGSLAGLFSAPTNVALDRRFVVFNVQALEPELRPLGIHLIASFVWNQVRRSRRPHLLIIDEAWSLIQYPEGGAFLASMARRARKYFLGLVTITQDVGDFLGVEQGRTVLANAATKLLMKQDSAIIEPVVQAFQLSGEERQFLLAAAKGEGLLFARGSHVAITVEASPAEHRLATTAPRETKVQKYAGSHAARAIVGQPRSTIDPPAWLQTGALVIVNTAKGVVGEHTAALLGATLLNLVALAIGEQAALDPRQRRPVTLIVDEFHTLPAADYEGILSELAKYGANLLLATQSLARLETLDREQSRALRALVFANLDGLFAFHTSAEDARYLVHELGGEVDEQDLIALGEHQCYVKLSLGGERSPTFSVRLDPPPQDDPDLGRQLATASALRYGRERAVVERDLRSAISRIELTHPPSWDSARTHGTGKRGTPGDTARRKDGRARSRHHGGDRRREAHQEQIPGLGNGQAGADDDAVHGDDAERGEPPGAEPA